MKNADMPAMPQSFAMTENECGAPGDFLEGGEYYEGLTKREMFAMHAMQGLLASDTTHQLHQNDCANMAVAYADALLEELDKEKDQ